MKYTSRADLLIAAGESIKMQTAAGIEPMQKYGGSIMPIIVDGEFHIGDTIELNEFPLAVVEGKPVFVGDELFTDRGTKFIVGENNDGFLCESGYSKRGCGLSVLPRDCSWNPPKPETVMVELLREDAEEWAEMRGLMTAHTMRMVEACRKALEKA